MTASYEAAVGPALQRAIEASLKDNKPILLVDDGGKLTTFVAKHFSQYAHLFRAVEQTTRGLTELATLSSIPMPVVDVAKSPLKKFEMGHIGEQVVDECEHLCSLIGLGGVTRKTSLVMGYGSIGEGTARALREAGSAVSIWDSDPAARDRARSHGFEVPESRELALRGKSLVIGSSGYRSLSREDLDFLSNECVVASTSSRDIEIDLSPNTDGKVEVVPLLTAGRGDRRFVTRVWRFQDKDVVILRNGFPLNFSGDFETGTPADIEVTRAAMLLGAAQSLSETRNGLRSADVQKQRQVVDALGLSWPT